MKKFFKWAGIIIGALIIIAAWTLFILYLCWRGLKPLPIAGPDGKPLAESVSALEWITIGGMPQAVTMRGRSVKNPVLLILHGGPGSPEGMLVRHFNAPLEDHFILVNWDQRGAGKSFSLSVPDESMNLNQFIADAVQLTEILRKRFAKEKIYLIGHSWGSVLGVKVVRSRPDLFFAYMGIGQVVNLVENEKLSYTFTMNEARRKGDKNALDDLEGCNNHWNPASPKLKGLMTQRNYLMKYSGALYGRTDYSYLYSIDTPPEYGLFDIPLFLAGSLYSIKHLWPQLLATVKLDETDTEFKVPVYLFMGVHDYNTPYPLAAQYFQKIKAPKKELVRFEKSAHMPNFEEPEKFNREAVRVFLEKK